MSTATNADLLAVSGVSKHFLGLRAVDDVSLAVRKGEIVSIIGPNGAGKTTFFNLLTGQLAPTAGEVRLRGERINQLPPHDRARLGMGRTFQIAKPLIALNALENVMIGAFMRHSALSTARDKAMAVLEKVGEIHRKPRWKFNNTKVTSSPASPRPWATAAAASAWRGRSLRPR